MTTRYADRTKFVIRLYTVEGQLLWEQEGYGEIEISEHAEWILVHSGESFFAFNRDGVRRWVTTVPPLGSMRMHFTKDLQKVVICTEAGYAACLELATGKALWTFTTPRDGRFEGLQITPTGDRVVLGALGHDTGADFLWVLDGQGQVLLSQNLGSNYFVQGYVDHQRQPVMRLDKSGRTLHAGTRKGLEVFELHAK